MAVIGSSLYVSSFFHNCAFLEGKKIGRPDEAGAVDMIPWVIYRGRAGDGNLKALTVD